METVLSVLMGVGLSAACGFRIFIPFLVVSVAGLSGHLTLAHGFEWIATWPALTAFGVATALEVTAYYVPWLDHLLDAMATPAALVAGTVITASVVGDVSPLLRWTLAAIAGGGAAGAVQAVTVFARATSAVTTGGLANPLVATAELGGAVIGAVTSVVVPVLALALVGVVGVVAWKRTGARLSGSS